MANCFFFFHCTKLYRINFDKKKMQSCQNLCLRIMRKPGADNSFIHRRLFFLGVKRVSARVNWPAANLHFNMCSNRYDRFHKSGKKCVDLMKFSCFFFFRWFSSWLSFDFVFSQMFIYSFVFFFVCLFGFHLKSIFMLMIESMRFSIKTITVWHISFQSAKVNEKLHQNQWPATILFNARPMNGVLRLNGNGIAFVRRMAGTRDLMCSQFDWLAAL